MRSTPSASSRLASKPGDAGPTSKSLAFGWRFRTTREGLDELRDALARIQVAEAAEERPAVDLRRLHVDRVGQAGCGMRQIGPW